MSFQIQLVNKSFSCNGADVILNEAKEEGVDLNYSCLDGRCSFCKAQVLFGDSIAIREEISLSTEDKNNDYILTCCRKAKSNMSLNIEDLSEYNLPNTLTIPAKIKSVIHLNEEVVQVTLRTPPNNQFRFRAGQYIDITRGSIRRSYSIASSSDSEEIVLIIKYYQEGEMSKYWFYEAKPNDLVRIEGPKGSFFLRSQSNFDNLVFLATGTGISPIKSILESFENRDSLKSCKKILLLWGLKFEKQLYWTPNNSEVDIDFIPVFSREGKSKTYVQDTLANLEFDLSSTMFYACGSMDMINSSNKLLIGKGLKSEQFISDAFLPTK